jgi:NitT/TauT family transport system substrate-binding protein
MTRGKLIIAAIVAALGFVAAAQAADPVKIRIGWVVLPGELQPVLFAKAGIAKNNGKTYVMEPVRFQGSPPTVTALAAGELEIAPLAFSTVAIAIQNAGLTDVRIISDEFKDGVEGYHSNPFMVRKNGPIQKVADLKGRIVATNAVGAAVDIASRAMLKKHGLEPPRDYTIVEASFPNMKAMLLEKKVELIPAVPPFAFDPGLLAEARTLFTQKEAVGTTQMVIWAARAGWLQKNRAAVVDFMEDATRAVRWYLDPANHGEAVKILSEAMKMPPERLNDWVLTKKDFHRDPDMRPDLRALQANLDLQYELGFMKSKLEISQYADLSIIEEAVKRIK